MVPGNVHDGRIYLELPLLNGGPKSRDVQQDEEFFKKAAPSRDKWLEESSQDSRVEGLNGDVIPEKYLDLKHVENSIAYRIGQILKVRTPNGVISARIAKYEIQFALASGRSYLYGIAEPIDAPLQSTKGPVIAAPQLHDCEKSCELVRRKPTDDETQRIRALALESRNIDFPTDIPRDLRTETLDVYVGHFTRTDKEQYVAFFARHSKDALDVGKWVTYVVDSDFSVIDVLGRDDYLQIIPDGIADVDGDGLDEIWCNEVGFEGTAYSLWYLSKGKKPAKFSHVDWAYSGL